MFDSWLIRTGSSRWRAIACAAVSLGTALYFWSDLCLWRTEANLNQRDYAYATRWLERSRWLGRKADARLGLLQLRIARGQKQYREVERLLPEAARLRAPRAEVERERLLALAQTGQFDAMQGHWEQLLADPRSDGPEIARAYYSWLMLRHELTQAEQTLKLWHADYPDDPEPLALAGRYYEAMVDWQAAEESYRKAHTLAPENDEYRLSLANALQARLKTQEAIPLFREFLARHPEDLVATRGLAQCLATNGDLDAALEIFRKAYESHPDDFSTQKAYGDLLLTSGDATTALPILEKAYHAVPEHANLANSLARALKASGRGAEAKPLFDFVVESRPQLDGLIALEAQLRKEPANLELRMKIAAITAKYVSRRDAIRWYQALLQISPNYTPAHLALADLYEQLGEQELADRHARVARDKPTSSSSQVTDSTDTSKPPRRPTTSDR